MARLHVLAWVALAAVGCGRAAPSIGPTDPPEERTAERVVEVTDAARAEFHRVAREVGPPGQKYRLRVSVVPGGCQGMKSKLDLDPECRPADATTNDRDVPVVYEAAQYPLIQGVRIDFVDEPGRQGFSVTYPHKTEESQRQTREWITSEAAKRGVNVELGEEPAADPAAPEGRE